MNPVWAAVLGLGQALNLADVDRGAVAPSLPSLAKRLFNGIGSQRNIPAERLVWTATSIIRLGGRHAERLGNQGKIEVQQESAVKTKGVSPPSLRISGKWTGSLFRRGDRKSSM